MSRSLEERVEESAVGTCGIKAQQATPVTRQQPTVVKAGGTLALAGMRNAAYLRSNSVMQLVVVLVHSSGVVQVLLV